MGKTDNKAEIQMGEARDSEDLIRAYKEILRSFLETRPSGFRKKISDAIGTNRSFVSQITNPNYRVPIPSHYVHTIMEVCHLSPIERTDFLSAYLAAHPGQAELINNRELSGKDSFSIDLSSVNDTHERDLIKQALKQLADTMMALSASQNDK